MVNVFTVIKRMLNFILSSLCQAYTNEFLIIQPRISLRFDKKNSVSPIHACSQYSGWASCSGWVKCTARASKLKFI